MIRSVFTVLMMTLVFSQTALAAEHLSHAKEIDLRGSLGPLPYSAEIVPRLMPTNQDRATDSR